MKAFFSALLKWVYIIVGVALTAISYKWFFMPNQIAPGGVTGLAIIINHLSGFPVGTLSLVINIPIFAFGMRHMGYMFTLKSVVATVGLSALIDTLPNIFITDDMLMASIFGGVILGVGLGLVLYGGATTGGTDMVARLIHSIIKRSSIGVLLFVIDGLVVAFASVVFDTMAGLYAIIAIYISTRVMDAMLEGVDSAKAFFIITKKKDEITQRILVEMERGVTELQSTGGFSGDASATLLCVVRRGETIYLKRIIANEDPAAFVIMTDVRETLGEGFEPSLAMGKRRRKKYGQAKPQK